MCDQRVDVEPETYAEWVTERPDPLEPHPFSYSTAPDSPVYCWPINGVPPCPTHAREALYLSKRGGDNVYCRLCDEAWRE